MGFNLFMNIVSKGDVESARTFLSSHQIDLNHVKKLESGTELTLLMLACKNGHLEMMELLIEKGAEVNFSTTRPVRSALMLAVEERNLGAVKLLLRHGAQVTTKRDEACALTIACGQGDIEMVQTLLPNGLKSVNLSEVVPYMYSGNLSSRYGMPQFGSYSYPMSPVNIAIKAGHLELLTWLLDAGAEVPIGALHLAISERTSSSPSSNSDMVKILVRHGATVNETGKYSSALMIASYYGDTKIVQELLEKGANVNYKNGANNFALWIAAMEGHTEVAKLLLGRSANVNLIGGKEEVSILQGVMDCYKMPEDKMVAVLKVLLEGGAKDPHKILTDVINRGRIEIMKLLLLNKDDLQINHKNSFGEYPLMRAVQCPKNNVEIVQLLLEAGAGPDVQDNEGKSLLMVVRNATVAKLLLDRGVDINQQDNDGRCALLHAMKWGNCEVIELLLERGANLDLPSYDGTTAGSVLQNDHHLQVCQIKIVPKWTFTPQVT